MKWLGCLGALIVAGGVLVLMMLVPGLSMMGAAAGVPGATVDDVADPEAAYQLLQRLESGDIEHVDPSQVAIPPDWSPQNGLFKWPAVGPISSPYGIRVSPIDGVVRLHAGIDIAVPAGFTIQAARAGRVVLAARDDAVYGQVLLIDHGEGYATLYAHCSALNVAQGDTVKQGQVIALAGSTGLATGPHLHFEIHYRGTPVDPLTLLPPR